MSTPSKTTPALAPKQNFFAVAGDAWKMAEVLARSTMTPDAFRGKPENVFLALELAHRVDVSAMHVMQNLSVINGKPFLAASFVIGMVNASGLFASRLRFDVQEDPLAATCYAFEHSGERVSTTVTWEHAKRAGWVSRKGSKYAEMPEIMLQYRAATFFARLHCPEIMFGFHTDVEADSFEPRDVKVDPLDRALAPRKEEPKAEPAAPPAERAAEELVSPAKVEKLVDAFGELGLGEDYVVARYGPLHEFTPAIYAEAVADGKARRAAQAEAEAAIKEAKQQAMFEEEDGNARPDYD